MKAHRFVTFGLAATLAAAALAPAAQADSWRGHGGWGHRGGFYRGGRAVIVREHEGGSFVGPALVGLVGGLALGTLISGSHSHPVYQQSAPPPDYAPAPPPQCGPPPQDDYYAPRSAGYVFEDPWTESSYANLDVYLNHTQNCDHPRVVRQIDTGTGECVQTLHYQHGRWSQCDPREVPGYNDPGNPGGADPNWNNDRNWHDDDDSR